MTPAKRYLLFKSIPIVIALVICVLGGVWGSLENGVGVAWGCMFGIVFGAASTYLALRVGLTVSASVPIAVIAIAERGSMFDPGPCVHMFRYVGIVVRVFHHTAILRKSCGFALSCSAGGAFVGYRLGVDLGTTYTAAAVNVVAANGWTGWVDGRALQPRQQRVAPALRECGEVGSQHGLKEDSIVRAHEPPSGSPWRSALPPLPRRVTRAG